MEAPCRPFWQEEWGDQEGCGQVVEGMREGKKKAIELKWFRWWLVQVDLLWAGQVSFSLISSLFSVSLSKF